jgi:hypothetical protein
MKEQRQKEIEAFLAETNNNEEKNQTIKIKDIMFFRVHLASAGFELIAYVVVNPTTIRSRTRRPLLAFLHKDIYVYTFRNIDPAEARCTRKNIM